MSTVAIIAEYNPFHNGHSYQLNEAKKITGADNIIAVMSGNFLQRGEPAMWNKYTRAAMSVYGGVDAAFELPFIYSTGSARDFASGAVNLIDALGVVDYLCFGVEKNDTALLDRLSDISAFEPPEYKSLLTERLSIGYSYPAACAYALTEYTQDENVSIYTGSPNNILALEYVSALKRLKSDIKPLPITRYGSDYHGSSLSGNICSAKALREAINNEPATDINAIASFVPVTTYELIRQNYHITSPVCEDDLSAMLQAARLNNVYMQSLLPSHSICDMSKELYNTMCHCPIQSSLSGLISDMSSRTYTASRIRRALLHLILNYTEADRKSFIDSGYSLYANLLGFRRNNNGLLNSIKKHSRIPIIAKKADFNRLIENYNADQIKASAMWHFDTSATELYNCMVYNRYGKKLPNDYTAVMAII